jgi:hypothetical protein
MAPEPEEVAWPSNYFNYFTEIEEHFQKARGTSLFLMSPLDWALVEAWKNAGVPLEAVLRGIDVAFEKWRGAKNRIQMVNSVAYCTQAVLAEAQVMASATQPARSKRQAAAPFSLEELQTYLNANVAEIRKQPGFEEIAESVDRLAAEAEVLYRDLEDLERRLTSLEEKMVAIARFRQTDDQLLAARTDLDRELRPYRGKMTADQLAMLEKQYLERRLLESSGLPRLSLFYLR